MAAARRRAEAARGFESISRADGRSMHTAVSSCYYVVKMFLSLFIVILNRRNLRKEIAHVHPV